MTWVISYSHLGENILGYPNKGKMGDLIKKYSLSFDEIFLTKALHELMSCFVILDKYLLLMKVNSKIDFELIYGAIVEQNIQREDKWIQV